MLKTRHLSATGELSSSGSIIGKKCIPKQIKFLAATGCIKPLCELCERETDKEEERARDTQRERESERVCLYVGMFEREREGERERENEREREREREKRKEDEHVESVFREGIMRNVGDEGKVFWFRWD